MMNKSMKNAASHVKTAANDLREEADSVAAQATRMARELLESAQEELSYAGESITEEMRANPWRSGLLALGLGVVIGALISRS